MGYRGRAGEGWRGVKKGWTGVEKEAVGFLGGDGSWLVAHR